MEIYLLIAGIGIITGFLSGLLGIGGGIVMAPFLLYIPPILGMELLPMRLVAGLTIVQGFAGCLVGTIIHKKFNFVSGRLFLYMGITIFIAAAAGGAMAHFVSNEMLLFIFASLAFIASFLMFMSVKKDNNKPDISNLQFSRLRAVTAASGVGLLGGMVGQGGSFILIPLMIFYVRIPTRIAIGSNLAIVLLSTSAAFIGKAATGQIEWVMTIPIIVTVVPAALLGGYFSSIVPVKKLRKILAVLIALAAIKMWYSVLF